jgi:MoaA/NifB/PqqE/SkfB family radical SAM enzyme
MWRLRSTVERALRRGDLIARLAETWLRRPDGPTRLVLQVTRRCNLRCEMCRTWALDAPRELAVDEIEAVLSRLPKLAWLDLTGGEPFVRSDAAQILDAVMRAVPGLRVLHFPTNGWFTSRVVEACRRVVARRPDLDFIVTVSIDGPPDVHDRLRGRPGSFDRALATLRALRSIPGLRVYAGTTITASNASSLGALRALLSEQVPGFHAREWHWNWLQISRHYFANEHLRDGAVSLPPGDSIAEHARRRGLPRSLLDAMELAFLVNLDAYRRGEPLGFSCQPLRSSLFLSPEGDVYPCHVYDRPLGNVRAQPIDQIWRSAAVVRARDDIERRLACGGCFTPCEAYPALAGSPVRAAAATARRSLRVLRDSPATTPGGTA